MAKPGFISALEDHQFRRDSTQVMTLLKIALVIFLSGMSLGDTDIAWLLSPSYSEQAHL